MRTESAREPEATPAPTSLGARLLNLFVCPGAVFDEVIVARTNPANWLVPTLLVCLCGLILLGPTTSPEQSDAAMKRLLAAGSISREQGVALADHWQSTSRVALCVGVFFGTFWSAFLLWFIGRFFLKSYFGFMKALEIAGLTAMILVLGTLVTALFASAMGDALARPALSFFLPREASGDPVVVAFGVLDCFQLWTTAVLAIGLSKLAGTRVREAAFWVFGYWIVARVALIILA